MFSRNNAGLLGISRRPPLVLQQLRELHISFSKKEATRRRQSKIKRKGKRVFKGCADLFDVEFLWTVHVEFRELL